MVSPKKHKFLRWLSLILICAMLIAGGFSESYLVIAFAICAALFWFIQFWLEMAMHENDETQKKQCRHIGFFMVLPAVGVISGGIGVLVWPHQTIPSETSFISVAIAGGLFVCLLLQFLAYWENHSTAGRFVKLVALSAMSVPLSLILITLLWIVESEDAAAMSCLTASGFGGAALLIAVNLMLVAVCGYRSTLDSIRLIAHLTRENRLVFARVSFVKDTLLVAGKLVISVISLSFFMFANALYSTGTGIVRFIAIKMHTQDKKKQVESYRLIGIIISAASICYVLYSVRLLFGGKTGVYDMNIALVIALYTFVEFGINIREAIRLHKSKALEAKALRAISFSSTLICFVLTQTAIMSFAAEGDSSHANALSGMFFGGLATLTGLYVIVDSFLHRKSSAP